MARKRAQGSLPFEDEGYSYDELRPLTEQTLGAGISVLVRGHPGVGKSALAAEAAASMGLELIDIRLAQRDPAEIGGVYFPDRDAHVLSLFPPEWVRAACDRPVFVFLDEINAAVTRLHQAAAYQIVLERRVGPFRFHPGTVVMAAGNLEEDNAIVSSLSSALCNRFAHYVLRVDAKSWVRWGTANGIEPSILAYISRHGEDDLYARSEDHAFASPRSWAMASRLYQACDEDQRKRAVAACVGARAAELFFSYLKTYRAVSPRGIIERGAEIDFTSGKKADRSFIHAAVFAVAAWLVNQAQLADSHLPNIVRFLRSPGLDPEFAFIFLRQIKRHPSLIPRLKQVVAYRQLAGELVQLHAALYR